MIRRATMLLCLGAAVLLAAPPVSADDEGALFADLMTAMQKRLEPKGKTDEQFKAEFLAHGQAVLAKCEDYRARFPKGPNITPVTLNETNVLLILAGFPGNADKAEKAAALARQVIDADPKAETAVVGRFFLVRYNQLKEQDAKTPEEGAPFAAEALKIAEGILKDSPGSNMIPPVLDFLAGAYDQSGREKEATAFYERIARDYPGTQLGVKATLTLQQRKLKGAVLDLSCKSVTGEQIDLKDFRGKVVVVDFWASWCGPCKEGLPFLIEAEKLYRDQGLRVIGISLDTDRAAMDAYVKEKAMTWPQYCDGLRFQSPMATKYSIWAIPTMFLVDREGKVREIGVEGKKLQAAVKKLLDEKTP